MTIYNDQISQYITRLFIPQGDVVQQVYEETPMKGLPAISITAEEGRFLEFLVRASGAVKAVEIGTLGGHSGIWIARGLPANGRLTTLEKEPYHAQVAREHFKLAGVDDRIEIREGDALHLLQILSDEGPFDFVFIDADKGGYPSYYEWAVSNLRVGGVVAAHNAFRKGSVAGLVPPDEWTGVAQEFNQQVAQDPRVVSTIFPAGDGTLIAVKVN